MKTGNYIFTDDELYQDCYHLTKDNVQYLIGKIIRIYFEDGNQMYEIEWQNDERGLNETHEDPSTIKTHFKVLTEAEALALIL